VITLTKTLIIIPSKDRICEIIGLMQNLMTQKGQFDIFVADMYSDPSVLEKNHYFRASLEHLNHMGHNYVVVKVKGTNQLYGYQAGLKYAKDKGYDLCLGGDDDLTYEPGFIETGIRYMEDHPECGILVGKTLVPWLTVESQTVESGWFKTPEFSGTLMALEKDGYFHCTLYNSEDEPIKEYEQVYGGFFFRPDDALKVGGFPTHLSPFGFRGEMMLEVAIMFSGKKQILNPYLLSWHYSVPSGGLRLIDGEFRVRCKQEDLNSWRAFVKRGTPDTSKVN
jgi:hypothetical protein